MQYVVSLGGLNGDFLVFLDDKNIGFVFRGFIPSSCRQFTAILLLCDEIKKRANLDRFDRPSIQVEKRNVYALWKTPAPNGGMTTKRELLFKEDPIKPMIAKFRVGYLRSLAEYYYKPYNISTIPLKVLLKDVGPDIAIGEIPYSMKSRVLKGE